MHPPGPRAEGRFLLAQLGPQKGPPAQQGGGSLPAQHTLVPATGLGAAGNRALWAGKRGEGLRERKAWGGQTPAPAQSTGTKFRSSLITGIPLQELSSARASSQLAGGREGARVSACTEPRPHTHPGCRASLGPGRSVPSGQKPGSTMGAPALGCRDARRGGGSTGTAEALPRGGGRGTPPPELAGAPASHQQDGAGGLGTGSRMCQGWAEPWDGGTAETQGSWALASAPAPGTGCDPEEAQGHIQQPGLEHTTTGWAHWGHPEPPSPTPALWELAGCSVPSP